MAEPSEYGFEEARRAIEEAVLATCTTPEWRAQMRELLFGVVDGLEAKGIPVYRSQNVEPSPL